MFVTKADLDARIFPEILALITRFGDAIIELNMATAESEIETYLGSRYDIRPELNRTGNTRHAYLLSLARDLAIYHIYSLQENVPAIRQKRYDQAITMLKMIQDGKSTLPGVDLAPIPEATPTSGQIVWGSNPRRPSLNNPIATETRQYI